MPHQGGNLNDMGPEERKAIQATTPDLVVDLRELAECVQDMTMGNLAVSRHMADAKAFAPGPQYTRSGSAAEAHQKGGARSTSSAPRRPITCRSPQRAPGSLRPGR